MLPRLPSHPPRPPGGALPDCFYFVTEMGTHSEKVPVSKVVPMLASGGLTAATMLWAPGMDRWLPLEECTGAVAGLSAALREHRDLERHREQHGSAFAAARSKFGGGGGGGAGGGRGGRTREKKKRYAVLVQRIISGEASTAEGIEAETLGTELEALQSEEAAEEEQLSLVSGEVLEQMELTQGLTEEARATIARAMERCEFVAGDVIFDEGDHGDYFYVVEGGEVACVRGRGTRHETELVRVGRGGGFGELALLGRAPRQASAVAATDASLLRVSRANFDRCLGPMVKFIKMGMQKNTARPPQSLLEACFRGSPEAVDAHMKKARHKAVDTPIDKGRGLTMLHLASALGRVELVRHLLGRRADPSIQARGGLTALHLAAREGHVAVSNVLVGASRPLLDAQTSDGATALYVAAQQGHVKVMKALMKAASSDNTTGRFVGAVHPIECGGSGRSTPLHVAAERNHFDVVSYLLSSKKHREAVDRTDADGATALHVAAAHGCDAVVWKLLERGANPHLIVGDGGPNAFFLAAQHGHAGVLQLLLNVPGIDAAAARMPAPSDGGGGGGGLAATTP
eukprot:COSAG01_NODE_9769_length_2349_cov_1.831111_2_plen_571_part_01